MLLDGAYFIKFALLYPMIAGTLFYFLIYGADHILFRIAFEPFVELPFKNFRHPIKKKKRLLDYDINKFLCSTIMTAGTYLAIRQPLSVVFSAFSDVQNASFGISNTLLICIFLSTGIFYGIRVTSVLVSGGLARRFGFAFISPLLLLSVFVLLFPEALPYLTFDLLEFSFVLIAIFANYVVFESGIYLASRNWERLHRGPDDIITSIPLLGQTIIGRDRLYLRLADIISESTQICGIAGTFAYNPRERYDEEYGEEFNKALSKYRDSFFDGGEVTGRKRKIDVRYIGPVDNDTVDKRLKALPNTDAQKEYYDKFDDIISRSKHVKIHHADFTGMDEKGGAYLRFLIGDSKRVSIETPVRAVPSECVISYYFENNSLVANTLLAIFETMWRNTIHVIEKAEQLREEEQRERGATGVTNKRFIELVEACIDCITIDLSNENNIETIKHELEKQIRIPENEVFEQFFNIIVQPENEEACKNFLLVLNKKLKITSSIELDSKLHLVAVVKR